MLGRLCREIIDWDVYNMTQQRMGSNDRVGIAVGLVHVGKARLVCSSCRSSCNLLSHL